MSTQQERLNETKQEFKRLVQAYNNTQERFYDLSKRAIDVYVDLDDKWKEHADECIRNLFFGQIQELFCLSDKQLPYLYQDEWFWAEWTGTDDCFYFVYGLATSIKERVVSEPLDTFEWNKDEFLCVWRGNYTPQVKVVNIMEADDYFTGANGFNDSDREEIISLGSGEYYDGDANGLFVFKG